MNFTDEARYRRNHSVLADTLSERVYNIILGSLIIYGLIATAIVCYRYADVFANVNIWVICIGYLLCGFTGGLIVHSSSNAFISFIGYHFIVIPSGLLLSTVVPNCDVNDVLFAVKTAVAITLCMIAVGTLYPEVFEDMGHALFMALSTIIVVEIITAILGIYNAKVMDYVVIGLFMLYVAYDWVRAQECPKTFNNAVCNAVDIYLDIINIFIRVLSRRSSSSSKK